jgi:hypothetical protein
MDLYCNAHSLPLVGLLLESLACLSKLHRHSAAAQTTPCQLSRLFIDRAFHSALPIIRSRPRTASSYMPLFNCHLSLSMCMTHWQPCISLCRRDAVAMWLLRSIHQYCSSLSSFVLVIVSSLAFVQATVGFVPLLTSEP